MSFDFISSLPQALSMFWGGGQPTVAVGNLFGGKKSEFEEYFQRIGTAEQSSPGAIPRTQDSWIVSAIDFESETTDKKKKPSRQTGSSLKDCRIRPRSLSSLDSINRYRGRDGRALTISSRPENREGDGGPRRH